MQCIYFLKEKNGFNTNVIVKDSLNHLSIHLTDFSGAPTMCQKYIWEEILQKVWNVK